jgi:mannan endo-1,4-beta-mannosidase
MAAYCSYFGISDITDWYTNSEAQAQYQKYIAAVVSRYKTSTAVFSWELANEPRCAGCDTSVITEWASTTSAYIKSLDSNHMVTMGDEGFGITGGTDYVYTNGPGLNFTDNLALPDIDFGTYHLYPDSWGEADSWGASWVDIHATVAATIGKPVILEEYGATVHTDEASWQTEVLNTNTAGDMYWQYGDTISTGQTSNDGNTIYYGTAEYTTLVSLIFLNIADILLISNRSRIMPLQ